jgi:hypothetical protein
MVAEAITYHNNSPVEMSYLWLQLDENEHAPTSSKHHMNSSGIKNHVMNEDLDRFEAVTNLINMASISKK